MSIVENEPLDTMSDEIVGMINYTRQYANEQMVALDDAIEDLSGLIGSYTPAISAVDTTIPEIDRPNFPSRPNLTALTLDGDWPDGFIPEPNLQEYGILDFDYVVPDPPQEIDQNFSFSVENYSSDMWQTLFSHIHSALLNGDYGMSPAVHSALVAKEKEARRRNQDREYRAGLAVVGSMGWNLPAGHGASFLAEFQGEVLQKDQDALDNITAQDFAVSNDWRKVTVSSAVDVEKMLRDTYEKVQGLSLEASKATKEYIARFYSENVKLYIAKWEGVKLRLESLKTKVEAISSINDNETKVYLGRAQVIESKIKAITEKNRGMVDSRKGEIDLYAAEVSAVRDEYIALVEEVKVNQEAKKTQIDKELRLEEIKLTAFSDKSKMAQQFAMGVAQIRAQGVASALGAINTSISNGYSASDSRYRQYYLDLTGS